MWHRFNLRCVRNPGTFSARPRQSFALDFLNIPQSFLFTRSPSFQPCCHFQSVFSLAPILLQIKGVQLTFCDENVYDCEERMSLHQSSDWWNFYRTQVSLGSALWVPVSLPPYKTFLKLCWCDSGGWWYQLNTGWTTGWFGVDGRYLDGGRAQCGVGKVVVQELHGMLELVCWWAMIMLATICVVGPLGRKRFSLRWWWTSRMT